MSEESIAVMRFALPGRAGAAVALLLAVGAAASRGGEPRGEAADRLAPRLLVPIHLWGDYSKMDLLAEEIRQTGFAGELWRVSRRGESRTYSPSPPTAGDR